MTDLAERIQDELIQAIERDQLVLPTLPEVALRIREAAEDPDVSIGELARVISTDTALSARLIKVVNSPLLRSRQEITDLQMAVNRLGVVYTANLATGLAMLQSIAGTEHPFAQLDWSQIPSFARLGLNPASDQEEEDLSAEMEAAMALLN